MRSVKICMIGDFAVGKTSCVSRFVNNVFSDKYQTTVGVKIDTKVIGNAGPDGAMKMIIWDLAGKAVLESVDRQYLRGAAGIVLVADGTRSSTIDGAMSLKTEVERLCGEAVPTVLLVNKCDLETTWDVSDESLDRLRTELPVFVTSAKTGDEVDTAFDKLADDISRTWTDDT